MQAWEQQVASLSRQLAKVTSEVEDFQRERHILLDSLRASEQVGSTQSDWLSTSALPGGSAGKHCTPGVSPTVSDPVVLPGRCLWSP